MPFVTDKQTLADLNLLGKYKAGSMFNLYNRVKTRGGELLLEDMFKAPFTDASSINSRARRIQYVEELELSLELNPETTEMAAQYLAEGRPGNLISSLMICSMEKVKDMMIQSDTLEIRQKHTSAVQDVLLCASLLLRQLKKKERSENPCKDMQDKIEKIINSPALKNINFQSPYTLQQTAYYHFLFLNKHRESLEELFPLMYEFDVYISVAQVAKNNEMVYAWADDTSKNELIEVVNLSHPSLDKAVGNTITLSKTENVLFLTGANMAGKSTWMKTLGISFYLAHMGFPVAADKMKFMVMDGMFTSINVPDDISLGWSHFYAEVMRVKLVSKEISSGKRLFILFDELFKGTNVKDAYDATLTITQKLARYRSCAFVISTHIIEVGEELMGTSNIQFHYMPTVMKGAVPHYTYNMTQGITTDRQGMIIIENEKILEMLS